MGRNSSDRAWQHWGEVDPYFAVVTKPQYRSGEIDLHREAFFEEGQAEIAALLTLVRRHFPNMPQGRALDFGCGVGRLVLPLARHFTEVVGLDISPAMLMEGEKNASAANLPHATFALSDDSLSGAPGSFDFVNSWIVLQHIHVTRGLAYMDGLLSRLGERGVAALHFTVDREKGALRDTLNWAQRNLPLVNNFANLARGRRFGEPAMPMNEYPLLGVLKLYESHGIIGPIVQLDRQHSTLAVRVIGQRR